MKLAISIKKELYFYYVQLGDLPIFGHGESIDQALHELAEFWEIQWKNIAVAPDRKLSEDARRLKKQMLKIAKVK